MDSYNADADSSSTQNALIRQTLPLKSSSGPTGCNKIVVEWAEQGYFDCP
jgi:hypothetical protein